MTALSDHRLSIWITLSFTLIISFDCISSAQRVTRNNNNLYGPTNGNILTLDWTNFTSTIELKPNAFVVQFYKHWCPYCKRFAPTWKLLAEDIKSWKPVVQLAVINCAHEENVGICREAAIPFVPTIHFYPSNWNFSSGLKPIVIKKGSVDALRGNITTLIVTTEIPSAPDLNPYTDPNELRNSVSLSSGKKLFFIGEKNDSKIGTEVILDNCLYSDEVTIKRVDWKSPWFQQLQLNESQLPVLVTLPKRAFLPIIVSTNQSIRHSRSAIDDIIARSIGITTTITTTLSGESSTRSSLPVISGLQGATNQRPLYVDDLYKCLQQILTNEILIYDTYSSEKISSLRNFSILIENYFPFNNLSTGRAFFNDLSNLLGSYESQLTIKTSSSNSSDSVSNGIPVTQLIAAINQIQQVHRLPRPSNWITCRGSNPIYRGYTCSLWLLWHTLSVNEYLQAAGQLTNHRVAFTMRSFIRDFFSCEECRQHFINETININREVNQLDPFSSIKYLWTVHNSVNKRIAGDPTEDPYFPKVQFPTPSQCSVCWTRGQFNDNQVAKFLTDHYKPSKWIRYEKLSD